jgi:hypothetical protein
MANVQLICLDDDDLLHENTGEPHFNESAYYNVYDPSARLGAFVRIGNRPNEGYAEMTACLYLPDGRVGFMFLRPYIANNTCFDTGMLRFAVRLPMKEHRVVYDGRLCVMERPLDLLDPKRAFTENPKVPAEMELVWEALSPPFGGEPRVQKDGEWVGVRTEKAGQEFARGHFEQHGRVRGRIVVDGTEWQVDGFGLRDRSWGPRYWQGPLYYRWLTMNFGADHGIAAAFTKRRDGGELQGGYVYERDRPNRALGRVEVDTGYAGDEKLHSAVRARLHPADGGAPLEIEGRVLAMVPLRNRGNDVTTRIAEGLTEWRWGDRVGYGWSEYLDHPD